MPKFTITRQFMCPVYQHDVVKAPTLEAACRTLLEGGDWERQVVDYESSGPDHIAAIAEGEHGSPYDAGATQIPVPRRFRDTDDLRHEATLTFLAKLIAQAPAAEPAEDHTDIASALAKGQELARWDVALEAVKLLKLLRGEG